MEIRFSKGARKALVRSNKGTLIHSKILELAANPDIASANIVKLVGRPEYRLRVQDWRVVFRVDDAILWIDQIGPRGSVYED